MNIRNMYEKELNELQHQILKMGTLVEKTVENSISAFLSADVESAEKIIKEDDLIDYFEKKIENQCVILIARQQPLAKDLRYISSIMKMITDLERIGDHASDISGVTLKLKDKNYTDILSDIPEIAYVSKGMITGSLDAYMKKDTEMAKKVIMTDESVDFLYDKIVKHQISIMNENPQKIEECVAMISASKYFEKIADHATNICEWVYYMVKGAHINFPDKSSGDNFQTDGNCE